MVEYGATSNLDHDDANMGLWMEALNEVNAVIPLLSYEQQKTYFEELQASKTKSY
jgi:hypothetical protein